MTDISSLAPHADTQLSSVAPLAPVPLTHLNGVQPPPLEETADDDESSTIKCICGYDDDDGLTALCERCNTWQHVRCYYPTEDVPEVHECADCAPRTLDRKAAAEHQRRYRDQSSGLSRKTKRPAPKGQRKKAQSVEVNGWPCEKDGPTDHKSGSPKDQPPPSKKAKTSHRSSASLASIKHTPTSNSSSRKRAGSSVHAALSPTKSPMTPSANGYPSDYFSPEYMKLCNQHDFTTIKDNLFSNIGVTNDLSIWLKDEQAVQQVTKTKRRDEIYQRIDGPIEELEEAAPQIERIVEADKNLVVHGSHPSWHMLTVDRAVPQTGFIGELKGHIGRKEEYCRDPSSRWSALRHPEPFVFFHPYLPIYIDARGEGNQFRYIRRSCQPNLAMFIIITDNTQYHFCFQAAQDISAGEEITIPWDIDERILELLKTVTNENSSAHDEIALWAGGVLGNFGGCACGMGNQCILGHFDRRNGHRLPDLAPQPFTSQLPHSAKMAPRKKRKVGNQRSPPGTGGATNSRAGSESVNRGDHDDDHDDSRSVSGSSRSKPASRDLTPLTHLSGEAAVGLGVELSDREKRKLMQTEKLFQQIEHDEPQMNRRKKRNSGGAGSAVNTPSIGASKQLGYPDSMGHRRPLNATPAGSSRTTRTIIRTIQQPRPQYVDSGMQTEQVQDPEPVGQAVRRRPRHSRVQILLQRRINTMPDIPEAEKGTTDKMDVDEPSDAGQTVTEAAPTAPASPKTSHPATIPNDPPASTPPPVSSDVVMKDAPEEQAISNSAAESPAKTTQPAPESSSTASHPPLHPPPPPWSSSPPPASTTKNPPVSPKAESLHVQLPPTPTFPTQPSTITTAVESINTPVSITGAFLLQSPSTTTPSALNTSILPSAISSMATPSPMKKKMSLSQYTSRKAKKNEALAAAASTSGTHTDPPSSNPTSNPNPAATEPTREPESEAPTTEAAPTPPPPTSAAAGLEMGKKAEEDTSSHHMSGTTGGVT